MCRGKARWTMGGVLLWGMAAGAATFPGPAEVFPFGVYVGGNDPLPGVRAQGQSVEACIERTCADLAAHAFNCVWPNNLDFALLPAWLDSAQRHGLRVVPQGGGFPSYLLWWFDGWQAAVEEQMKPFYYETARKYRDHPALLAYSVVEEIPPDPPILEAVRELTQLTAALDPHHPMIVLYNRASSAELAARMVRPRVLAWDGYPFFADPRNGPSTAAGRRSYFGRQIQRFYEAGRAIGAPVWVMGQGMDLAVVENGRIVRWAWRRPTPTEMRWQVWTALLHGAKGFFLFLYGSSPGFPENGEYLRGLVDESGQTTEIYEAAAQVSRDLEPYKPLLLQLEQAPPDREVLYWENNEAVEGRTFIHRDTGIRYLLLVNHDTVQPRRAEVELGLFPRYLSETDRLVDLRTGRQFTYETLPSLELEPGDGTILFVGSDAEWATHQRTSASPEAGA